MIIQELILIPYLTLLIIHTQIYLDQAQKLYTQTSELNIQIQQAQKSLTYYPKKGPLPVTVIQDRKTPHLKRLKVTISNSISFERIIIATQ